MFGKFKLWVRILRQARFYATQQRVAEITSSRHTFRCDDVTSCRDDVINLAHRCGPLREQWRHVLLLFTSQAQGGASVTVVNLDSKEIESKPRFVYEQKNHWTWWHQVKKNYALKDNLHIMCCATIIEQTTYVVIYYMRVPYKFGLQCTTQKEV